MKTLIVVTGPTAVGKTDFCMELAECLHTPIINADSRQLFRDLRIGTAQPTTEQQARVRHYFVRAFVWQKSQRIGTLAILPISDWLKLCHRVILRKLYV